MRDRRSPTIANSPSTTHNQAGSNTTPKKFGRRCAPPCNQCVRKSMSRLLRLASPTNAKLWWLSTAARASRSSARLSGKTAAPPPAATCSPTSCPLFVRQRDWCLIHIFLVRKWSGCYTTPRSAATLIWLLPRLTHFSSTASPAVRRLPRMFPMRHAPCCLTSAPCAGAQRCAQCSVSTSIRYRRLCRLAHASGRLWATVQFRRVWLLVVLPATNKQHFLVKRALRWAAPRTRMALAVLCC